MGRLVVELCGICAFETAHVARELDARDLHAEAEAVVGDVELAGILRRDDLALDAAAPEPAGHEDPAHVLHILRHAVALDVLRRHLLDLHLAAVGDARVGQGFVDRLVGVLELKVLADDRDRRLLLGRPERLDHLLPLDEVGLLVVSPSLRTICSSTFCSDSMSGIW